MTIQSRSNCYRCYRDAYDKAWKARQVKTKLKSFTEYHKAGVQRSLLTATSTTVLLLSISNNKASPSGITQGKALYTIPQLLEAGAW